ncbi:MAG: hypothetical protein E6356_14265 [Terrisporobacter othiniensis]|nr:hypothetical protein [Terrisporobacter othiniensis]
MVEIIKIILSIDILILFFSWENIRYKEYEKSEAYELFKADNIDDYYKE